MKIVVINGPNLNFLGIREKTVYGSQNYEDLLEMIYNHGVSKDVDVEVFQSNHEGEIIDFLQECYYNEIHGLVINPGAFTHYSYAIRDAISSIMIPTVEVHISNIHEREDFRKISVVSDVCVKQIYGKGLAGYLEGMDYLIEQEK